MSPTLPERPGAREPGILQPCAESCAAFRPLDPNRWSDYGLCLNPRSPRRGYPARVGHDCRYYLAPGGPGTVINPSI